MSEGSLSFDAEVAGHQVIFGAGQVEAAAELYWAAHESRYPSRPGDDVPHGNVYDSTEALVADIGPGE